MTQILWPFKKHTPLLRSPVESLLPSEIWLKIASSAALMVKLSCVSRQFYSICMQPHIWQHFLLVDFAFYTEPDSPNTSFLDEERLECIAAIYKYTLFATNDSWDDYNQAGSDFIRQRGGAIPYDQFDEMDREALRVARKKQWERRIEPTFRLAMYEKIPSHIVQHNSYYAFYKKNWLQASLDLKSDTDRGFICLKLILKKFNPALSFAENVKDFAPVKQRCRPAIETLCHALFSNSGIDLNAPVIRTYYRTLFVAKHHFKRLNVKIQNTQATDPPSWISIALPIMLLGFYILKKM